MARLIVLAAALSLAAPALAAPLTVKVGETWAFKVAKGEPVRAHRITAVATPPPGEIKVSVSTLMGTTMTLTNNSEAAYTFRAELLGVAPSKASRRTCTLPPKLPTLESWPLKATAVRLHDFRAAPKDGSCP